MSIDLEEWRNITSYEGLYQVSNLGRVRSLDKVLKGCSGRHVRKGRILKQYLACGYVQVTLQDQGRKPKRIGVHVLVLQAFVGPCPEGMECRHFPDRNRCNNHLSNLQWATHKQNCADRLVHGTHIQGEAQHHSKLTEDEVLEIRRRYATGEFSQYTLAKEFNTHQINIGHIVRRESWKHI